MGNREGMLRERVEREDFRKTKEERAEPEYPSKKLQRLKKTYISLTKTS